MALTMALPSVHPGQAQATGRPSQARDNWRTFEHGRTQRAPWITSSFFTNTSTMTTILERWSNIYIYIYVVWLVVLTILKNMKVNGKDDMPYMKWKIKHVPNHQPVVVFYTKKWPAFCGAYPWLTRLPFTAETPERLPAQRRAWTKHRPPQHPPASWNPGEVGDGMNWLTKCTLMNEN